MQGISSEIKMVGRAKELDELKTHLHNAMEGHGNTVFIAGEAGVGKTRLLEELKGYAREQGVDVLQGWSLYESLTPYMPFLEALRSGGLENLFADEAPRVEAVYLVSHSGMSIKEVIREETKLDPDIFTGMLTAVGDFVQDSLSMLTGEEKKGTLNTLGYENYRIQIENIGELNLAVIISGRENEFLVNDMKEVLVNVHQQYGDVLKSWDGNEKSIEGIHRNMELLITSGKYDGIDYAKDDPQIKRNRTFENILLGFERHTKVNPTLLCIEDLQWADPSSLALMHYVARNTRKCNFLILGTYRPEDVSTTKDGEAHHLIEALQLMSREDLYKKINLERLEESFLDEMLKSLLGDFDFADDFKHQVYMETEGNPFFIVSLIRMLIEEKTVELKDNVWILTKDIGEVHIPSKVYDVIIRRLFRVKEKDKEILDFAAVIGEEFTSDFLAKTIQVNKIELLKGLRILEQNHKLIRPFDHKYKFDHTKIKEVIYQNIPKELRMEYHGKIANSIETMNMDNLYNVIEELAFHYYRSINKEKALLYLIKAAEMTKNDYSNLEAILFYKQALELEKDNKKRMDIFQVVGDIFKLIGRYDESIDAYEYALKLTDMKKKKSELITKIAVIHREKGNLHKALELCSEAYNLIIDEECTEKGYLLKIIATILWEKGEFIRALKNCDEGLRIQKKIGNQMGIAECQFTNGLIYQDKGEYAKALKSYYEALDIFKKSDRNISISTLLFNIGHVHKLKGEFNKAYKKYQESLEMGERMGSQVNFAFNWVLIGDLYLEMNKYNEALEKYEKSLIISKKIGNQYITAWNYFSMAETYLKIGYKEKAFDFCTRSYKLSNTIGVKETNCHSIRIFGMIYREQKNWKLSIKNFEEALKLFNDVGMKRWMGITYYEFGLMWKQKGDVDIAREHLNRALNIYKELNLDFHVEKVRKELQNVNKKENRPHGRQRRRQDQPHP